MVEERGFSANGLPYVRFGNGSHVLVVFDGLSFENKAPSRLNLKLYRNSFGLIAQAYSVYLITRKPGLPRGYSTRDMA
ncbi:hypothetical protein KEJ45_07060 [Candidatus Bathyarchaeota archaeon]|nr:hypothetical protein [Candidatus Bathyarchaeota archaeon]